MWRAGDRGGALTTPIALGATRCGWPFDRSVGAVVRGARAAAGRPTACDPALAFHLASAPYASAEFAPPARRSRTSRHRRRSVRAWRREPAALAARARGRPLVRRRHPCARRGGPAPRVALRRAPLRHRDVALRPRDEA